jgi:hypothetical protein
MSIQKEFVGPSPVQACPSLPSRASPAPGSSPHERTRYCQASQGRTRSLRGIGCFPIPTATMFQHATGPDRLWAPHRDFSRSTVASFRLQVASMRDLPTWRQTSPSRSFRLCFLFFDFLSQSLLFLLRCVVVFLSDLEMQLEYQNHILSRFSLN